MSSALIRMNIITTLLIFILYFPMPSCADVLPHGGVSFGPAQSSKSEQVDVPENLYFFLGIQTEYYVTYEIGINHFSFTSSGESPTRDAVNIITGSALAHLPIGGSSVFARISAGTYTYTDDSKNQHDGFVPAYGLGLDIDITKRVSLRLEWQRFLDLEYQTSQFDIDVVRAGFFFYF